MNWFFIMKRASDDSLSNIRMLIESGLKAQLAAFKRHPAIVKFFYEHRLQSLFVTTEAAVNKILDLVEKYKDFHSAIERANSANQTFITLVHELARYAGPTMLKDPIVNNVLSDLKDVTNELMQVLQQKKPVMPQQPKAPAEPSAPKPADNANVFTQQPNNDNAMPRQVA